MNDDVFLFAVVPGVFAFVGFVFTLIFGRDVLQWYRDLGAAKAKSAAGAAAARPVADRPYVPAPAVLGVRDGQLVPG